MPITGRKWTLDSAPGLMISLLVGLTILTAVVTTLWSSLIAQFQSLSTIGNFSFSSLFDSSTGVTTIVLSAVLVFAIFGAIGLSLQKRSRR